MSYFNIDFTFLNHHLLTKEIIKTGQILKYNKCDGCFSFDDVTQGSIGK